MSTWCRQATSKAATIIIVEQHSELALEVLHGHTGFESRVQGVLHVISAHGFQMKTC